MKLSVSSLSFSYSGRPVLEDVSFTLPENRMTCLLGANGSGKSTLLRLLTGFLRPGSGKIVVDGTDLKDLSARERAGKIAYIPQESPVVYAHTVKDLVLMGRAPKLGLLGRPGKEDEEKAEEALGAMGIERLSGRPVTKISGGEKQLALLARALVQESSILLLDEPAAALDYSNRLMVLETLTGLAEKGYSVLCSTHNPEDALLTDSHALALLNGRVTFHEELDEPLLSGLYGRRLILSQINTGEHIRTICVPV